MTTPTTPEKRFLAAGMVKGSAWGTALAVGANKGVLLTSDGGIGQARNQPYLPAKEMDTPVVLQSDLGDIEAVDVSPEFWMRYDPGLLGTAIAALFGTAGAPAALDSEGYKHTFQWADRGSIFLTYAVEKPGKIYEIASAKPKSFELSLAEGLIKGKIGLHGNTVIDNSTVNTATQMDALTYIDRANRIAFSQGSFKINDEDGGDVASESALNVNGFSIGWNRSPDAEHVAGSQSIIEPAEAEFPEFKIHLDFPRADAVNMALFQKFIGKTAQKMLIKFTGNKLAAGTYYYDLALFFPRLIMVPTHGPTEDDILKYGLDLVGEEAASNPTGMSYKRPYIELQNKQATDYLA